MTDPEASADELERTVRVLGFKGALISEATDGCYLDHPSYEPLLTRAEALDMPIYVHPAPSSNASGMLCMANSPTTWASGYRFPDGDGMRIPRSTFSG